MTSSNASPASPVPGSAASAAADAVPPAVPTAVEDRLVALLTGLVQALVEHPDEVTVEANTDGNASALRLHVAGSDLDKVLGKQGRTARSLRTILSTVASKHQHRISLDVLDSNAGDASDTDADRGPE